MIFHEIRSDEFIVESLESTANQIRYFYREREEKREREREREREKEREREREREKESMSERYRKNTSVVR